MRGLASIRSTRNIGLEPWIRPCPVWIWNGSSYRASSSTSRHMMKSSKSLISAVGELAEGVRRPWRPAPWERFRTQRTLVSERRLQADRPCLLGLLKQPVEDHQIVVERVDLDPFARAKWYGSSLFVELGGMKAGDERGDVEDQHAEGVVGLELEPAPVRVVEHQLDVGPLGDDLIEPALVLVVSEDLIVELAGLYVGDPVEVDAVEVREGRELVAVEAGGPGVVEVVLGLVPTRRSKVCRASRRSRGERR